MHRLVGSLALLLTVACSAETMIAAPAEPDDAGSGRSTTADAAGAQETGTAEPRPDAAPTDRVDAATTPDTGPPDAIAPLADSGGADAEPCVESIKVPTSPGWVISVTYKLSETTSKSVPYTCTTTVDGNSCKFSLGGGPTAYPPPGACRVAVPAKCLPCTGGVTEW